MTQSQSPAIVGVTRTGERLFRLRLRSGGLRRWRWMRATLLAVLVIALVRSSVLDWRRVTGNSMSPSLAPGQLLICNRLAYGCRLPGMGSYLVAWSAPQPGELVIYSSPSDGECCVKRVVAPPASPQLAAGEVWVLGDNSEESCDSRDHGPVPISLIHGRAHVLRR